jgi:hypothetical protein
MPSVPDGSGDPPRPDAGPKKLPAWDAIGVKITVKAKKRDLFMAALLNVKEIGAMQGKSSLFF